jgi:hypothetical protein
MFQSYSGIACSSSNSFVSLNNGNVISSTNSTSNEIRTSVVRERPRISLVQPTPDWTLFQHPDDLPSIPLKERFQKRSTIFSIVTRATQDGLQQSPSNELIPNSKQMQKVARRKLALGFKRRIRKSSEAGKPRECVRCRNHDTLAFRRRHECPWANCNCDKCTARERFLARHRGYGYQEESVTRSQHKSSREVQKPVALTPQETIKGKMQQCKRCRIHGKFALRASHSCPLANCKCRKCVAHLKLERLISEEIQNRKRRNGSKPLIRLCLQCRAHGQKNARSRSHDCHWAKCDCAECELIIEERERSRVKRNLPGFVQEISGGTTI